MLNLKTHIARFLTDESGATAIEYGLIAALIGVAIIGAARSMTSAANNMYSDVDGEVYRAFNS